MNAPEILYEDNHLLVAVKPCNIPSQADVSGDIDMLGLLKSYIAEKYQKTGNVYLGLVHRLDRPAGGVMVFARTSKAAARLTAQIQGDSFHKEYLCVCEGEPPMGSLRHWLLKDSRTNMVRAVPEGTKDAKEALLEVETLQKSCGLTLARILLHTGRSHQIRVQMSASGCPLWGDQRYNPNAKPGQQLALWSHVLGFDHPVGGKPMQFVSKPDGGVWERFEIGE